MGTKIIKIESQEVQDFLGRTGDSNKLHQAPTNLLPGMFYLNLASGALLKPIRQLEIAFKNPTIYPCSVEMWDENYSGERKILFSDSGKQLCDITAKLGESKECSGNPNLDKIRLICSIPGELVKKLGEGVYIKQQIRFLIDNLQDARLEIQERGGRSGIKRVGTNYVKNGKIVAEGSAIVGSKEMLKETLANLSKTGCCYVGGLENQEGTREHNSYCRGDEKTERLELNVEVFYQKHC